MLSINSVLSYEAGAPHLTVLEHEAVAAESYESRGILHSEMALILHACRRLSIEVVIESGRARAQSTYMLAKYLPDVEIHSIEGRNGPDQVFGIERVAAFPNVVLYQGDGALLLPRLCEASAPHPTAVLCDGPKGIAAVGVVEKCFRRPHVRLGFIHDMRRLDHGGPSPYRAAAEAVFPKAKFSDDPALTAALAWMDQDILAAGGPVGPAWETQYGSYGPTIGIFLNPLSAPKQTATSELGV